MPARGLRVGLVDVDPLSDIATLLDLQDSEEAIGAAPSPAGPPGAAGLDRYTSGVLPGLDLLFPAPKLDREESRTLLGRIFRQHAGELDGRYDLLIFDLPAGSDAEENLAFLPFMSQIVLVTNPEPTAHVSAGAYVRRALETVPEAAFRVWHNRYAGNPGDGFDPADLAGNYNRNVPEELRLGEQEAARLEDFCFVPEDPSLNLLKGEPDALLNLLYRLAEVFRLVRAERLRQLAAVLGPERRGGDRRAPAGRSFDFVLHYMGRHRRIDSPDGYLEGLAGWLSALLPAGAPPFRLAAEERRRFGAFLQAARDDRLCASTLGLLELLEERIRRAEGAHRLFSTQAATPEDRALDRECGRFLMELGADPDLAGRAEEPRGPAPVLLRPVQAVPVPLHPAPGARLHPPQEGPARPGGEGPAGADPPADDPGGEHRREFLRLLRTLYPVLTRQLSSVVRVFHLRRLVFRDPAGAFHRRAYLTLLTHFLHDTLFSGLSVVVGFSYRPACAAFQRGAERLLESLGGGAEPPPD